MKFQKNKKDIKSEKETVYKRTKKKGRYYLRKYWSKFFKDFKKTNAVSFLATRFRHYGIGLLAFTTQSFRAVSGLIRNNATDVIIMKQQNNKELEKINEEYGDLFPNIFMELYKKAIEDAPYSFLYLDMQTNPASAYIRFETKIAEGEKKLF